MINANEEFRNAIQAAGLNPPEIIEPGKLHRFPGRGKCNGNTAGWCKLFEDGLGGVFGDWAEDISETWQAEQHKPLPQEEREAFRKRCEQERRDREAEEVRKHAEAAAKAAELWNAAMPELGPHKYLVDKGIKAHGVRTNGNQLVIPMRDGGGLKSLQFIGPDGEKRFLPGGQIKGCYFSIGKPNGVLCICEGFATGASIHEATGHAVAVAFNAGNLEPVAKAMRSRFPDIHLILCADDDHSTEGNAGLTKATQAARAIGGRVAIPVFGEGRPENVTDFNDMAALSGLEAVQEAIAKAMLTEDEKSPAAAPEDRQIAYRRALDIQAKPIHWLWPGRIARGKVSMLAGNPGLGKSQVTASMTAIVTVGGTWPVDRTKCTRGNVVILSAEDDPEDTIRPRLEVAGADLSRVFILDAVVDGFRADGGEIQRAFNLKTDLERLGTMLDRIGGVALIVIDPITAYLGDADSHKNAEIRALLAPLSSLAAKHGAAVVCVSHLNKGGGGEALMRVTGSLAFVAAARAAFIVTKDQEKEGRRLFLPLKNNIGNDQGGLAFAVQSGHVASPAGIIETSHVVWEAEAVTVTADEAMASWGDPEERNLTDEAKEWLSDFLRLGPAKASDVKKEATQAGISNKALRRAREKLGIKPIKQAFSGGWQWALPDSQGAQGAQGAQDVHTRKLGTFSARGHLGQEFDQESEQERVTL